MKKLILVIAILFLMSCAGGSSAQRDINKYPCECMDPGSWKYDPTASHPSQNPWKK